MFTACSKDSLKKVDFGGFSGLVPSNWQKTNLKGIDSNVSIVITDKNDTLVIDYGKFSDQFNEIVEVRSLERKADFDSVNFHYPENMVFSENANSLTKHKVYI